ncbi:DUF1254 domain-containing protein [Paraburkholderia sp. GAS334]|uniref:DUF1254 domain-containing protein n=1 Tax=Paraburkholderia sp. GAS334 TaxID=3035131 RepID=UPI003D1ACD8B
MFAKIFSACAIGIVGVAALARPACAASETAAAPTVAVTADNYIRAETDKAFTRVASGGGFGQFQHVRRLTPVENQYVVRPNRDTLYSLAVIDLDAGPVTVSMPDPGKRFMSLQVIDENHYTHALFYGQGTHTFSRREIGTRYVLLGVRTLVNPANAQDVEQVHTLQDATKLSQNSRGRFEAPNWDQAGLKKIHDALLVIGATVDDTKGMFGSAKDVDPVRHLLGTAIAWGGSPEKDAFYLPVTPAKNDGETVYRLSVKDVPVDGFWSISVYDAEGFFEHNSLDAYSLNNITAKRSDDGSVEVQFGGCDGTRPNCLPVMPGWNYLVRLYRAHPEALSGKWKFPEAQAVN